MTSDCKSFHLSTGHQDSSSVLLNIGKYRGWISAGDGERVVRKVDGFEDLALCVNVDSMLS